MSDIYVNVDEENVGPLSIKEVNKKIKAGDFSDKDIAWFEGMDDWLPLNSKIFEEIGIKGFNKKKSPPPLPPKKTKKNSSKAGINDAPVEDDFLYDKAFMAVKAQRFKEAQTAYENLLEKKPTVRAWTGLGICKLFQILDDQEMEEVLYCFNKAKDIRGADIRSIELEFINYLDLTLQTFYKNATSALKAAIKAERDAAIAAGAAVVTGALTAGIAASNWSSGKSNLGTLAVGGGITAAASGIAVGKLNQVSSSKETAEFCISKVKEIEENFIKFFGGKFECKESKTLRKDIDDAKLDIVYSHPDSRIAYEFEILGRDKSLNGMMALSKNKDSQIKVSTPFECYHAAKSSWVQEKAKKNLPENVKNVVCGILKNKKVEILITKENIISSNGGIYDTSKRIKFSIQKGGKSSVVASKAAAGAALGSVASPVGILAGAAIGGLSAINDEVYILGVEGEAKSEIISLVGKKDKIPNSLSVFKLYLESLYTTNKLKGGRIKNSDSIPTSKIKDNIEVNEATEVFETEESNVSTVQIQEISNLISKESDLSFLPQKLAEGVNAKRDALVFSQNDLQIAKEVASEWAAASKPVKSAIESKERIEKSFENFHEETGESINKLLDDGVELPQFEKALEIATKIKKIKDNITQLDADAQTIMQKAKAKTEILYLKGKLLPMQQQLGIECYRAGKKTIDERLEKEILRDTSLLERIEAKRNEILSAEKNIGLLKQSLESKKDEFKDRLKILKLPTSGPREIIESRESAVTVAQDSLDDILIEVTHHLLDLDQDKLPKNNKIADYLRNL